MTTIADLFERYGVEYVTAGHRHCRPGWVQVDCPQCGPGTRKFHLGYCIEGGYMSCWKCGGKRTKPTLMEVLGVGAVEVERLLEELDGGAVRIEKPVAARKLVLPKPLAKLNKAHRKYLRGRGFNVKEIVAQWKPLSLGPIACMERGDGARIPLNHRIFIPIELGGKVVSWTTRGASPVALPRYISAPEDCEAVPHKTLLYGIDFVRHAIVLVEGPLDAWRIGPGAVAVFGTAFSRAQVLAASRFPVRAVCFDNEPEAQRKARELVDLLAAFPGKTYNILLDSADPGSATQREIQKIRRAVGL